MNLVTRSQFAVLAGVSRSAITKACKKQLAPACEGVKVDVDHPSATDYIANRNRAPAAVQRSLTSQEFDALVDAVFVRVLAQFRHLLQVSK